MNSIRSRYPRPHDAWATWNVNSVKQRIPVSCPGSTNDNRTSSAYRRPNSPTTPSTTSSAPTWPNAATRSPTTARASGTASHCCPASASTMCSTVSRYPRVRGAGWRRARCRRCAATSASIRCTCPTAANRTPRTTSTNSTGSPSSGVHRRPGGDDAVRRRQHRPTDADVYDRASFEGHTHVTAPERDALAALEALGLTDVVRRRWPDDRVFSYWDYRAGMFHKDLGMRDRPDPRRRLPGRAHQGCLVDRLARKGTKPSDHAPVVADLTPHPTAMWARWCHRRRTRPSEVARRYLPTPRSSECRRSW